MTNEESPNMGTQNYLTTIYKQFLNKAIQIQQKEPNQPHNPNLYNEKGVVLQGLKRYAEAEAAITEAIKLSPRAAFYINRGGLYSDQEKWNLSLADYNKAIHID